MDTDATPSPKPKRRWFQFRLRTLLVVVTLAAVPCAYVAHEWRIVQERERFLCEQERSMAEHSSGAAGISWVRRLMGDHGYSRIALGGATDIARRRQEAGALFPEARIMALSLRHHSAADDPERALPYFTVEFEPFPDEAPSPQASSDTTTRH